MKEDIDITKDIACAKTIIKALQNIELPTVTKDNILPKEIKVFINDSTQNRAIRELSRLGVLVRSQLGYKIDKTKIIQALERLETYYKGYITLNEIEDRLHNKNILTREEINNLLPELTIQQIDYTILQLVENGTIVKYGGDASRGVYSLSSNETNTFIPDTIKKLFQVYNDIIICYNTALEYYNLSRYASSRVVYISGKTSLAKNKIFEKKIKNVTLDRIDLGIINLGENQIKVTDKERTIIDCIRYPQYALGWENIFHALQRLNDLDEEKILDYLKKLKTPTLTSKVGVLLENFSKDIHLSPGFFAKLVLYKSNTPFRLLRQYSGSLNKKWNIYIPDNIFENA